MIYSYLFLLIIITFLLYMRYEAGRIKVEKVRFTLSAKGLKIVQLSDIHMRYLKISVNKLKNIICSEKPDIIIMTGDYIDNPMQINDFIKFINDIKCDIDVYLCMGNHDHKAFIDVSADISHSTNTLNVNSIEDFISLLYKNNINVLHNKAVCIEKNNKKYNLIGIDDMNFGNYDIEKALSYCDKNADINIAFSHNPDIIYKIPKDKVDYLFCGHFHGGQIWLPFRLEYKLLRKEKLCKMGINRGLHKINGINLYINRGLGNVCFPLRFLSRPEITVFCIN